MSKRNRDKKKETGLTTRIANLLGMDTIESKKELFDAATKIAQRDRAMNVANAIAREFAVLQQYEDRMMITQMGIDHRKKKIAALEAGEFTIIPPGDMICFNDPTLNTDSMIVGTTSIGL